MVHIHSCFMEHQRGMVDVYDIPVPGSALYEALQTRQARYCRSMHRRLPDDRLPAGSTCYRSRLDKLPETKRNASFSLNVSYQFGFFRCLFGFVIGMMVYLS